MNEPFGKLYTKTYSGSMAGAGLHVFGVMCYAIAHAKPPVGEVELNPLILSTVLGSDIETMQIAIDFLCSPDPKSRSKKEEGRRMVKLGEYKYKLINWIDYRNGNDPDNIREYMRLAKAKERAKKKEQLTETSKTSKTCQRQSRQSIQAEAEAYAEAEAEAYAESEVPQIPSPKAPVARRRRIKPLEASETQPALITLPAETNASLPVTDAQAAPPSASPQDSPKVDDHNKLRMQFIEDFCSAFKARFAVDYTFDGGKDGSAVKKLLSRGLEPVQILDTAKKAWDNGSFHCKNARTLHGLNNYYTQINVEVNGKDTNALIKAPARVDRNAGTCNENIDHDKFAEEVRAYNRARFLRPASESNGGSLPAMAASVEVGQDGKVVEHDRD